jgi:hypothetical protein
MRRALLLAALLVACNKRQDGDLPPATEWSAETSADPPPMMPTTGMGRSPHAAGQGDDPHAGVDMSGGDPHAGVDMSGGDPHAGVDLSGGDPHAGVDMSGGGTDVTRMGLASPDPNRPIDPTHRITGVITADDHTKAQLKPGTAIFVIVKRAGAMGPVGAPLAVDKLVWSAGGVPFQLTEAQAMIAGTELTGDVVVSARYDQDSDAISKQPGDVTGQLKVHIPADRVQVKLDTVLP